MNNPSQESRAISPIQLYDEHRRADYIRRSGEHIAVLSERLVAGTVPDALLMSATRRRRLVLKRHITVIDLGQSLYGVWDGPRSPTSRIVLDQDGQLWFTHSNRLIESQDYHTFSLTGSLFLEFRLSEATWRLKEASS